MGDCGGLTSDTLIRSRYMSPILSIANVDDGRLADAVSSGSGTVRLAMKDDVSDLFLGQNGGTMVVPVPGHSVTASIHGVVEMSAFVEMIDVDARDIAAYDMADDLSFWNSAFVPNPYKAGHKSFTSFSVDDENGTTFFGFRAGPFDAACRGWRTAEIGYSGEQRVAARPIVSEASEFFSG